VAELWGDHRAFKMKFIVPSGYSYANDPSVYGPAITTNIPSNALPSRAPVTGSNSFGFSVGNANYLSAGVGYHTSVAILANSHWVYYGATVEARASTNAGGGTCMVDAEYAANWCVFDDYSQRLLRQDDFFVANGPDSTTYWGENALFNQSFEDGMTNWGVLAGGGSNWVRYCDGSGFRSTCYVENNQAGGGVSVYQDRSTWPVRATNNFTHEVMLRCRPNGYGYCGATLAIWALGGSNPNELRSNAVSIPADNQWWLCRMDWDHAYSTGLTWNHDFLRFEVYNDYWGANLDIDYASLSLYHVRVAGTTGDPLPPAGILPSCVRWDTLAAF
jgi:hypothetical protein